MADIISDFVEDSSFANLKEEGCAICGCLTRVVDLTLLKDTSINLDILCVPDVTRKCRESLSQNISSLPGLVLATNCDKACFTCLTALHKNKMSRIALANGL